MSLLPIVDTHVHLWDPASFHQPWLDSVPFLKRPFTVQDYQEQTSGIPIEAMICVEVNVLPEETLQEAHWFSMQAQHDPRIQGIVAAAPIGAGTSLRTYLETLQTIDTRIKGVRRNIQDETLPGFCLQPAFVQDIQLLATYDLSFDLCLVHSQLPDVIELVRRCPNTRFVLDHLGKPAIRQHILDPWREQIQELAQFPNVACKISGLVTEADMQHWVSEDIAPYVTHILATFGEERIMFGGDWPVMLLASSYGHWIETVAALTSHLSDSARRKLWSENARRIYRL